MRKAKSTLDLFFEAVSLVAGMWKIGRPPRLLQVLGCNEKAVSNKVKTRLIYIANRDAGKRPSRLMPRAIGTNKHVVSLLLNRFRTRR